nr:MAG TPA: hypothetical protein [Bacteriophage sp.]
MKIFDVIENFRYKTLLRLSNICSIFRASLES